MLIKLQRTVLITITLVLVNLLLGKSTTEVRKTKKV